MIYVTSQPDNQYFHWQVKVYVRNFMKLGVNPNDIHAIFLVDKTDSPSLTQLKKELPINIFSYQIEPQQYVAAYKPQGMKFHAEHLRGKFFYHDSDVILLSVPRVDKLCSCAWYASDCKGYLGVGYIKSKGEDLFEDMCNSIGVNPAFVEHSDTDSGGAQWVMNNTPREFWEKVERDSVTLLKVMQSHASQQGLTYPIQSWTAEMWSTLWNTYAYGKRVRTIHELDFIFSTSKYVDLQKVKILHNAGVLSQNKDKMFFKGDYLERSPLGLDLSHLSREFASWKYVEELY